MVAVASPRSSVPETPRPAWTGFELDGEAFAFASASVERVLPATAATALPFAPAGVEGVVSIAGDVVPVLALSALLSPDRPPPVQPGTQFLILRVAGRRYALRADRMLFVATVLPLAETEPASLAGAEPASLIEALADWRGRSVKCLAVERLGLEALKPFLPPSGAPGPVADGRATVAEAAVAQTEMILTVEAAGTSYGLRATSVAELLENAVVTPLPLVPSILAGVAILRGRPILTFSLARLLGADASASPGGYVVVVIASSRFVLAVDAIGRLQRSAGAGSDPIPLDLEALLPVEWFGLAAEMSGTPAAAPVAATDRQRFLCVSLGDRSCALALAAIERILPPRPPIRLPSGAPAGVDGAIEFGGRILPVTQGWRWLSRPNGGVAAAHIVLQHDGERRILAVDAVQRIVTIAQDDILPTGGHDPRIAGLGQAGGRSLEILSTTALMARGEVA
jgi:chemotaxis signal transduction protein